MEGISSIFGCENTLKLKTFKVPTPLASRLKGPTSPFLKLKGPFMRQKESCPERHTVHPVNI